MKMLATVLENTVTENLTGRLCGGYTRKTCISANHKAAKPSGSCLVFVPARVIRPDSITDGQSSVAVSEVYEQHLKQDTAMQWAQWAQFAEVLASVPCNEVY